MAEEAAEVRRRSQVMAGGRDLEETLIELKNIYKIYEMGDEEVRANDGISLTIPNADDNSISLGIERTISWRTSETG